MAIFRLYVKYNNNYNRLMNQNYNNRNHILYDIAHCVYVR